MRMSDDVYSSGIVENPDLGIIYAMTVRRYPMFASAPWTLTWVQRLPNRVHCD